MSIVENETNVETDDTNLDDFSAEFFGQDKAQPEETKPEINEVVEDSEDAPPEDNQDTQDAEDKDDAPVESEDNPEDEPEEAPKPKKNSAQERISELTAARREAERKAEALEARLAELEAKVTPKNEPTPTPASKAGTEVAPPKPTDTNEDGTEKYPLGEFDPDFITDLADFRVEQRFAERDRQVKEAEAQARQQQALGQLEAEWNTQVETARERYPDYTEKLAELQPVFSDVDENYGDYLSNTLMSMEKGADILYYLAENPDEARSIIESGPQRATIALGRLEARFIESSTPPPRKVSKAPTPPPTNKGSSAARGTVAPDTDDLDAFETLFFNKK